MLSAQVVMRQSVGGDGVFHLKEVQALITSSNDSVKVLMVLPTDIRPEHYRDIDIKNGDEILMVNKARVKSVKTLEEMYNNLDIGAEFKMGIRRDGNLSMIAFKKIDPKDLPQGQNVQIRTSTGSGAETGRNVVTRTLRVDSEGSENMQPLMGTGLMVGEEGGQVKVMMVMDHMKTALGDVDLKVGDVIKTINGTKITSLDQIMQVYDKIESGKKLELTYGRDKKDMQASFTKPEAKGRMIIR
jgi:PDZ domain-containing secreted protein